ncbi:MAG: Holliday junction resolvase RuvX [Desulfarculaceae bacterium]|nr:Holliday junction resolvase RuvX [Desulfarculaceae bacterium]MCF8072599.1 Holliday junction resolvase RuvX [Desulfarculaceae bacterium]MCF8103329.1 Holliday junction resolvase RuvX [Desulfarculaceae bacterium]MCF8118255.1 Holliday junction resolvase RuvX [Desulfarculaceae bacterium]
MSEQPPGVVLALDVGSKRIGLAVSDPERRTASPLLVYERKNRDADVAAIGEIAAEQGATLMVVGLPARAGGELSPEGERILSLAKRLERRLGLPVELMDEALSTVEAHEAMIEAGLSRAKRAQVVDRAAAAIILRRWLEARE